MSARIVVQSGISAGASHWIEKSVVRIGSDTSADMVIPSTVLDAHALTIAFRQNGYRVYNRGAEPMFVGGRLVQPNGHANWNDTDLLELPDGVTLALELDAETTRPSVKATASNGEENKHSLDFRYEQELVEPGQPNSAKLHSSASRSSQSELKKPVASGSSKALVQLSVIGLCIIGSALLLIRNQMRGHSATEMRVPQFDSVIRAAMEDDSPFTDGIVERLQAAEAAFIRGQLAIARVHFRQLHDTLAQTLLNDQLGSVSTEQDNFDIATSESPSPASARPPHAADIIALALQLTEHRLRQISR